MSAPQQMRRLEAGDEIRLRLASEDDWTEAGVLMVSSNGKSILVSLDGPIKCGSGIAEGKLPLSADLDAGTIESLFGDRYQVQLFDPGDEEITITVRPE
jgi:hypothetical protein